MKKIVPFIFIILLWGCTLGRTPAKLAKLPKECPATGASGEIVRAELATPKRGYPYSYRVYLPPCFAAESGARYPVLYLIPGRSSAPDTWFNPGLAKIVDGLILSTEIPPFLMVTTENTDNEPMADTIYNELIPFIESQYPVVDDRLYRAVAGGSLGGIAAYRLAFQHPDKFFSAGVFGAGAISGEEARISSWLSAMTDENRIRVFMDTGDEDLLMLDRAQVMKSILDEAGIENQLHVGHGGHNYDYWVSNFETYLRWMTKDW